MEMKKIIIFCVVFILSCFFVVGVQYQFDNKNYLDIFNITNVSYGRFDNLCVNESCIDDWSDVNKSGSSYFELNGENVSFKDDNYNLELPEIYIEDNFIFGLK